MHLCTAAVNYHPIGIVLVIIFQNQICKVTSRPILKYYARRFFFKTVFNRALQTSVVSLLMAAAYTALSVSLPEASWPIKDYSI